MTEHLGKKPLALLAYLALAQSGAGREEVAALLWPGPDAATSRHNLRQCLVSLRRLLGESFENLIEVSDEWLRLRREPLRIDVLRLLEIDAGAPASAEELIDLCRGTFLRSLVTRARPFDDWAAAQRDRFAGLTAKLLEEAYAIAKRDGRSREAARLSAALADLGTALSSVSAAASASAGDVTPSATDRARPTWRSPRRQLRFVASFAGGALVAAAALSVAYYASDEFRDSIDTLILGAPAIPPRIAVQPFTSLNGTLQETSLAGGVTLGVTYGLYTITAKELFVVTPPQAENTPGLGQSERIAVAQELGVRYLISGSVGVDGDRVRVYVQCLDAEAGIDIWQESLDQPMARAFKLQDAITLRILKELEIDLSTAEQNRIQYLHDTEDLRAWLYAADALRHLIRVNRTEIELAKALYGKALEADPNYIGARRGLAWAELLSVRLGWAADPRAAILEAKNQLGIVLRNAPDEGTTKSLEGALLLLEGRYDEAVAVGEQAVALLPGSADVHAVFAHTLTYVGQHGRALEVIERAMQLSPRHPAWYRWTKARALRLAGRSAEAVKLLERDMDPSEPVLVHLVELTAAHAAAGKLGAARRTAGMIRKIAPGFSASAWLEHPRVQLEQIQSREFEYLSSAGL